MLQRTAMGRIVVSENIGHLVRTSYVAFLTCGLKNPPSLRLGASPFSNNEDFFICQVFLAMIHMYSRPILLSLCLFQGLEYRDFLELES